MTVKFKSGPNQSHFASLKAGDTFIFAEQASIPTEKRLVFMRTKEYEGRGANTICLSDGDICFVPAKALIIKVDAELFVSL